MGGAIKDRLKLLVESAAINIGVKKNFVANAEDFRSDLSFR